MTTSDQEWRRKRTAQFAKYLKLMEKRTLKDAKGSCFMIFETGTLVTKSGDSVVAVVTEGSDATEDPDARFIQFSFEKNWFCLDMPNVTLQKQEAEQILRDRNDFFYVRNQPEYKLHEEDFLGNDPFRKIYKYGRENLAAQDMDYIFHEVWKFPVETTFYVSAKAFEGKRKFKGDQDWEERLPIS